MNPDVEVLRRAKSQLQQLQGYVEEFYDLCGTTQGLQECVPLLQKADLTIKELRDRWPLVQTLLKHDGSTAPAPEAVQAAWEVHEAQSWGTQAREHSNAALGAIQQHLRTHIKFPPPPSADVHLAKRPRIDTSRALKAAELEGVIQRVRRTVPTADLHFFCAHSGLTGSPSSANEVRLVIPKVLVACISLSATGTAAPIRVALDSAEKKADASCGWGHHSHLVFRRITALAARALCYYTVRAQAHAHEQQPGQPSPSAVALQDLLLWLCSYQDLFSRPCAASGKLLAWDPSAHYPIPPTLRPYMLMRAELEKVASDPLSRTAYHMHHAPTEMLSWQEEGPERHEAARSVGAD